MKPCPLNPNASHLRAKIVYMWHSTTPSSSLPHTCKREFRAVLPEQHQHLSCVVCPGSFAHVAFGLGLFALCVGCYALRITVVLSKAAHSGPSVCQRARGPCPLRVSQSLRTTLSQQAPAVEAPVWQQCSCSCRGACTAAVSSGPRGDFPPTR